MDAGYGSFNEHFLFDVVTFFFLTFVMLGVVVADACILVSFLDVSFELEHKLLELWYGDRSLLKNGFELLVRKAKWTMARVSFDCANEAAHIDTVET